MATVLPSPPSELAHVTPLESLYRLSVEQYHQLAAAGILTPEDHVELIEGVLVRKITIYPPHAYATKKLDRLLSALGLPGWCIRTQQPITLADSEPEPDGAVVRGQDEDYLDSHPGAADVGLVCEVADRSLAQDRGWKKRLYAKAGLATYWIVNLVANVVEVYEDPAGDSYQRTAHYARGERIPVVLDGKQVGEIEAAGFFRT